MSGDKAGTVYVKVVVKNVESNTQNIVSDTVYALFPAMHFSSSGPKTNGTAFNYQGEASALNRNTGEAFVLRNGVFTGLLCQLVDALRNSVTVVTCRMLYITAEGTRVKIEVTP